MRAGDDMTEREKRQHIVYEKPEIIILGDATHVIEQTGSKLGHRLEFQVGPQALNPAYDLDE